MKKVLLTLIIALQTVFVFSQNKELVPEEIMSNKSLYASSLNNIEWQPGTSYFTWQTPDAIIRGNANTTAIDTILKLNAFNQALMSAGKESVKRIPSIDWRDSETMTFTIGNDYYSYKNGQLTLEHNLPETAENGDVAPNSQYIAYTIENNLFISEGKTHRTITSDQNKGIVNGQTVHRNEFGINKGTYWSPNATKLAFYRMDETMVTDYPNVDITARVAELMPSKYPMAGMTSHHVTVGVYDMSSSKIIFLNTGEPKEQYLTNIAWSPDEKYIFIAVLNRDQNHMKFNQYDALTGDFIKTLFEEKNDRYVEPMVPMVFVPGNPNQFIWQSQRDGYNHLYLYDINGKLIKQLTSGNWVVTEMKGFDNPAKGIFYNSTETSPIQEHLYYVDLKSGKRQRITTERGVHNSRISSDGKYVITTWNNLETPPVSTLINIKSKKSRELHRAINPLAQYNLGKMTISTIKAADNTTDLYYRLIKPSDFDSTKKYPVFLYVYGGPHDQLVTDIWMSGGLFLQYMAQQGYVVFTLDNRGSQNRGFEFESIIHRRVGEIEMADQMKGVEYLMSLPWVDSKRIGVDGWSYGGFMTVNMKLNYPEIFKVASAGGPVCDWKYYEVMYGERYMDTPEQNPEGYKNSSLIEQAGKLQGKLLIMHGGVDPTVVSQQSLDFVRACIENKKQLDYFVYPTHEHNVSGIDRAHMFRKISEYFKENL